MGFVSDAGKKAFVAAIQSVEGCSCAEVVIAVRHHSGSYLHVDVILAALAALGTLAFTLFSSLEFSLWSILIDPPLAGLAIFALSTQLPGVRRLLTPPGARRRRVATAARAVFFEKGVRMTQDRIGILIYLSLLERAVELVADAGVKKAMAGAPHHDRWTLACQRIEDTLRKTMDPVAVAKEIERLGDVCEPALPRSDDDVNELADEVSAP